LLSRSLQRRSFTKRIWRKRETLHEQAAEGREAATEKSSPSPALLLGAFRHPPGGQRRLHEAADHFINHGQNFRPGRNPDCHSARGVPAVPDRNSGQGNGRDQKGTNLEKVLSSLGVGQVVITGCMRMPSSARPSKAHYYSERLRRHFGQRRPLTEVQAASGALPPEQVMELFVFTLMVLTNMIICNLK